MFRSAVTSQTVSLTLTHTAFIHLYTTPELVCTSVCGGLKPGFKDRKAAERPTVKAAHTVE